MSPKEIEKLTAGSWALDCSCIALTQRTSAHARVYSGPGWVRQTHDGEFAFKILVKDSARATRRLTERVHPPGAVIPDEEYFDLCATDEHGREWKVERIRPKRVSRGLTHSVIEGVVPRLVNVSETVPSGAHARLLFPERIEIPCTTGTETTTTIRGQWRSSAQKTNVAEVTACGHRFLLLMDDDVLWLEIEPEDERLAPQIEARIMEALEFVLARPMPWVLREREDGKVQWTEVRPRIMTRVLRRFPPIFFTRLEGAEATWTLCAQYLKHVINHKGEEWHPLSERVHSVLAASAGSLETHALTLGVEIEGILKSEFHKVAAPDETFRDQIRQAVELINTSSLVESAKKRIANRLKNMCGPTATDQLRGLTKAGKVTAEYVRAWADLRNRLAHAGHSRHLPLQEFIDLLTSVTVLLHQLVFTAIGYRGSYTDYGSPGWPQKTPEL